MSTGRHEAKRAEKRANLAAEQQSALRVEAEEKAKRERTRAQKLFVRQVRSKLGGGFLSPKERGTLG